MIKDSMRLFLHSVDRDIETLEGLKAPPAILDKLRGMQDTARSIWAEIYSSSKREAAIPVTWYLNLNIIINNAYNEIVNEHVAYMEKNNITETGEVEDYILNELFLSYSMFLDAYHEQGFYYVMCANFPMHNMGYFAQQKQMREAARKLDQ